MEAGQRVRIKRSIGDFDPPLDDLFGYLEIKDPNKPENWWVKLTGPLYGLTLTLVEEYLEPIELVEEEKVRKAMEYQTWYNITPPVGLPDVSSLDKEDHTFLVILPGNDRRHIQATYMEVDGGCLYFEDDSQETVLAFGPGHWVWAERLDEEESQEEVAMDYRDYDQPSKIAKIDESGNYWVSINGGETWEKTIDGPE